MLTHVEITGDKKSNGGEASNGLMLEYGEDSILSHDEDGLSAQIFEIETDQQLAQVKNLELDFHGKVTSMGRCVDHPLNKAGVPTDCEDKTHLTCKIEKGLKDENPLCMWLHGPVMTQYSPSWSDANLNPYVGAPIAGTKMVLHVDDHVTVLRGPNSPSGACVRKENYKIYSSTTCEVYDERECTKNESCEYVKFDNEFGCQSSGKGGRIDVNIDEYCAKTKSGLMHAENYNCDAFFSKRYPACPRKLGEMITKGDVVVFAGAAAIDPHRLYVRQRDREAGWKKKRERDINTEEKTSLFGYEAAAPLPLLRYSSSAAGVPVKVNTYGQKTKIPLDDGTFMHTVKLESDWRSDNLRVEEYFDPELPAEIGRVPPALVTQADETGKFFVGDHLSSVGSNVIHKDHPEHTTAGNIENSYDVELWINKTARHFVVLRKGVSPTARYLKISRDVSAADSKTNSFATRDKLRLCEIKVFGIPVKAGSLPVKKDPSLCAKGQGNIMASPVLFNSWGAAKGVKGKGCQACTPGKYNDIVGKTDRCKECMPGEFQNLPNAQKCQQCEAGTISTENASSLCAKCSPGKYIEDTGQTSCKTCPEGKFGARIKFDKFPISVDTGCADCVAGKYS